jgi:4-amino-4-deoxy-L-arabinose transferase-like glycosyltransferase
MSPIARKLLLVLGLSLLARGILLSTQLPSNPRYLLDLDTPGYVDPALALHHSGVFAAHPDRPDVPGFYRTPGYPALIALLFSLFGEHLLPVVILQALLMAGTLLILFRLAADLGGDPRAGLAAALLLAVDPVSLSLSLVVMSETLFTFLLMAGLLFLVRLLKGRRRPLADAHLAGLALALATLTRPILYGGLVILLPVLLPTLLRKRTLSRRMSVAAWAVFAVPVILLVGGWQARNRLEVGTWRFNSGSRGIVMILTAADVMARAEGIPYEAAQERLLAEIQAGDPRLHFGEDAARHDLYTREALKVFRRHPLSFAVSFGRGVLKVLLGPGRVSWYRMVGQPPDSPGSAARLGYVLAAVYLGLVWLLAARGVAGVSNDRDSRPAHLLLAGICLWLVVMAGGPEGYSRFRVPVMPVLCLYAGLGYALFFPSPEARARS